MKNFLTVAVLVTAIFICGCGSKYSDETLIVGFAFWTEDRKNIPDMLDAINTADTEFLAQQIVDGKVYHADRETKIAVTDEYDGGETIEIKFLEGRYKNKVGYTLAEFVRDVGKEREQTEIEQKQHAQEEQARKEREQAAFDDAKAKDTTIFERLTKSIDKPLKDGVQIVCEVGNGTPAYCKIIGVTNLPNETKINVTIGTFTKAADVHDGKISVLIGRSAVSVGEQNLLITTLDKNSQPPEVQAAVDGDDSIFGKQIYSGKVQIQ